MQLDGIFTQQEHRRRPRGKSEPGAQAGVTAPRTAKHVLACKGNESKVQRRGNVEISESLESSVTEIMVAAIGGTLKKKIKKRLIEGESRAGICVICASK